MKICNFCGAEHNRSNSMCGACYHKYKLSPRFVKARDELRRLTGLAEKSGGDDNE